MSELDRPDLNPWKPRDPTTDEKRTVEEARRFLGPSKGRQGPVEVVRLMLTRIDRRRPQGARLGVFLVAHPDEYPGLEQIAESLVAAEFPSLVLTIARSPDIPRDRVMVKTYHPNEGRPDLPPLGPGS